LKGAKLGLRPSKPCYRICHPAHLPVFADKRIPRVEFLFLLFGIRRENPGYALIPEQFLLKKNNIKKIKN
jgi:hypothetical protein